MQQKFNLPRKSCNTEGVLHYSLLGIAEFLKVDCTFAIVYWYVYLNS